jgi:hypothetical protein
MRFHKGVDKGIRRLAICCCVGLLHGHGGNRCPDTQGKTYLSLFYKRLSSVFLSSAYQGQFYNVTMLNNDWAQLNLFEMDWSLVYAAIKWVGLHRFRRLGSGIQRKFKDWNWSSRSMVTTDINKSKQKPKSRQILYRFDLMETYKTVPL